MENTHNKAVRIRIKFSTGEEFEAEGDKHFIEQEKDTFLKMVGKRAQERTAGSHSRRPAHAIEANYLPGMGPEKWPGTGASAPARDDMEPQITPTVLPGVGLVRTPQTRTAEALPPPQQQNAALSSHPALLRRTSAQNTLHTAENRPEAHNNNNTYGTDFNAYPAEIWHTICKVEGGVVLLRRKHRLFTPGYAALVALAAAQTLLPGAPYSALSLAKTLKHSSFMAENDRLDRLLQTEIKTGYLTYTGYKRSRIYQLSGAGYARAYVFAQKIAQDYQ